MRIVKNWLDKDVAYSIQSYLLKKSDTYSEASLSKSNSKFFSCPFDIHNDTYIKSLFPELIKQFKYDIEIIRSYANLQFTKMDGEWHTDDGQITCLWMATKSLPKGSGTLEVGKEKIKFDFNKLVMFDAKTKHRGLAPKEFNTPRITLAFKTEKHI